ncbi:MAG TPA: hemerythrin domain-containing protein [Thermoanaerobaculia bacterium]|jgi:hemerythrin superfamily protein|nr:hemerythrin domain-containing protein [Thermoanaerobaculia bacterium]
MAATKKKAAPPPDAIRLLKDDHKLVMGLLEQFESATGARRQKLLGQITKELEIHTTIEEEIFYPAFREAARKKDDQTKFYEAVHEHRHAKMAMSEAGSGENNEELKAKAKVLKELIEHHAEEEEKEMFPRAKEVMDRDELKGLGARMLARKVELK